MNSLSRMEKIAALIILAAIVAYITLRLPSTHPQDDGHIDQQHTVEIPE